MSLALKDALEEPKATCDAIHLACQSPVGLRITWIIVEAEEDLVAYSKFVDCDNVNVMTSLDSRGRRGCVNVENIVKKLKDEFSDIHILGIRDADYIKYVADFVLPENIFLTDGRDLEMMLLKSSTVQHRLDNWTCGRFASLLQECISICRFLGYLRIYNDLQQLLFDFNKTYKITQIWDFAGQHVLENWRENVLNGFQSQIEAVDILSDLEKFINVHSLEGEEYFDLCRGHDFLILMSLMLVKSHIYSIENIMHEMITAYTLDDFKMTSLYKAIRQWQIGEGVIVVP